MEKFLIKDKEGLNISCYKWLPKNKARGVVQIVHGMAETALRYNDFAERLVENGYIVYAHDHRGHGETAVSKELQGYIAHNEGFYSMVENIRDINKHIKKNHVGLPHALFGHSMGSFLSERYVEMYGDSIDALILSGSNGKPKPYTKLGIYVSKTEMLIRGRKAKSRLMDKLSFGDFNKKFKPNRTAFDWLSSDNAEVDKFIADENCGFICSTSFYFDLIRGLWDIHKVENMENVPKDLPIYIFSGDRDPVGNMGEGVKELYEIYKAIGIRDIKLKIYENGRHEMLKEVNKEQVMTEIIEWLTGKI